MATPSLSIQQETDLLKKENRLIGRWYRKYQLEFRDIFVFHNNLEHLRTKFEFNKRAKRKIIKKADFNHPCRFPRSFEFSCRLKTNRKKIKASLKGILDKQIYTISVTNKDFIYYAPLSRYSPYIYSILPNVSYSFILEGYEVSVKSLVLILSNLQNCKSLELGNCKFGEFKKKYNIRSKSSLSIIKIKYCKDHLNRGFFASQSSFRRLLEMIQGSSLINNLKQIDCMPTLKDKDLIRNEYAMFGLENLLKIS
ncbi:unnamed protein product [Moneuplotes crassus]|uniref:Uncharacterized protein n=1 Tax=Euplotes crassus TaxID=5936 RepID=A0AAD1XTG3_EUPCR|nr:unnamed protein product [Moneuplotes crassus]